MSDQTTIPFSRGDNGVRKRADGEGDAWANAHREKLGHRDYIQDVDAFFGMQVFGHNTGERLFLEYEPDDYENRGSAIRRFAIVGLFDRKRSPELAFSPENSVSLALYLYTCRVFAQAQPQGPKFFYVFGAPDRGPWQMQEVSIETGEAVGSGVWIAGDDPNWHRVWDKLGLRTLRRDLRKWLL